MPPLASPPSRIHLLSPELAHQIAAGEVVERPASVLKELLENALDAGARRIEIEVEAGGTSLIRVRDNGCGIHHDDLRLALSSHATSKIHQPEELLCIKTLGFRGEALASIGAVSRLRLSSRIAEAEHGWCLQENAELQPIAHPLGTTVEARDLFYNTPARRRFLRGEKTEFMHLRNIVERLALSHFEVGIRMHHNRRPILALPPCTRPTERLKRIARICGRIFVERSSYYERTANGLHLWGWIGHPDFTRSQTDLQYCYVNHRLVRDKLLQHAARQAYGERLRPGRHPAYLLYLELPASQVDVNAHPAKHEVRFREARQVHSFVARTLTEILEQDENEGKQRPLTTYSQPSITDTTDQPKAQFHRRYSLAEPPENYHSPLTEEACPPSPAPGNRAPSFLGHARAMVLGRYLLAENSTGLLLIDFFAARTRLAQAQLSSAYRRKQIIRQPMLFPLIFKVTPKEAEYTEQQASLLHQVGLGIQRLGAETVVLREIPAPLRQLNLERLLPALLAKLALEASPPDLAALKKMVVEAVQDYPTSEPLRPSLREMDELLRELEVLYQAEKSPLRPPPWRELSRTEIEGWFTAKPV